MVKNYKVTTKFKPLPVDEDSELSLFDPANPDINLFNSLDEEIIRLGGSKLYYYKTYTQKEYDEVYLEDRSKSVAHEPIKVNSHYDPKALEKDLGDFGIELTNDIIFGFNKTYITQMLGREPKSGDIVEPLFQNQKYEIFEVQEDGFDIYSGYRINCHAKLLRDRKEIHTTPKVEVSDDEPLAGYSGEPDDNF